MISSIIPYKGRNIDPTKPVKVYRNLNKEGVVYSVQQFNLVVAHASDITLKDCTCVINYNGWLRAINEKRRNVHATVFGFITNFTVSSGTPISYNPFKYNFFYTISTHIQKIEGGEYMRFNEVGVMVVGPKISSAVMS